MYNMFWVIYIVFWSEKLALPNQRFHCTSYKINIPARWHIPLHPLGHRTYSQYQHFWYQDKKILQYKILFPWCGSVMFNGQGGKLITLWNLLSVLLPGNVRSARGSHSIQLQLTNSIQLQVTDNNSETDQLHLSLHRDTLWYVLQSI